ncbi:MAG: DUF58 domain-containing protein [Halorientalis sp.]
MPDERVRRYDAGLAAAAFLVGAGVFLARPALLAAAAVPLAYVAYDALSTLPEADGLVVERTVSPGSPDPGERVRVSLAVTNGGESTLADLRVVDGVPEGLAVVAGSPRAALALAPGDTEHVTYELVATRGEWAFDAPAVRQRSLSATRVRTHRVEATGDDGFTCQYLLEDAPLRDRTIQYSGPLATDAGGEGNEFHATRAYRPGDPVSRIDWRRLARTGDLGTIEFRDQRAANVVLVVDARPPSRVAADAGFPTGSDLAGYAATRGFEALVDAGHPVGVTALGLGDAYLGDQFPGPLPWVDPGLAEGTLLRAEAVFGAVADAEAGESPTGPAGTVTPDGGDETAALVDLLPAGAQVILFSPAVDEGATATVRTLRNEGHAVTVVSPDVTGQRSLGQRIARMERHYRLRRAIEAGAVVVDWDTADPLEVALATALEGLLDA